jgi:hypothetical protein
VLNWLLRALMLMGGAAVAVVVWPVAQGAWEAQPTRSSVTCGSDGRSTLGRGRHRRA